MIGCLHPIPLRNPLNLRGRDGSHWFYVPCGKCYTCRKERSKAWAIRLMLEHCEWPKAVFVTLTYDDEHVPKCQQDIGNVRLKDDTLDKKDFQDFMKRLRKRLDSPIKYYACGEYGSHTFRPHYHAIIYGLSELDVDTIQASWPKGFVDVGDVTLQSCNYVAGYVQKKLYGNVAEEVYGARQCPFSLMSKGLGRKYFEEHWQDMINQGFIRYRDKHIPIPRYFWKLMLDDKIDGVSADDAIDWKRIRKQAFEEDRRRKYAGDGIPDGLRFSIEEKMRECHETAMAKREELMQSRSKI